MKVFLSVTSVDPAYGGPAHSVTNLADALAGRGVEVGLWAPDNSATTTPLLRNGSGVKRLAGSTAQALDAFGRIDIIHDNGIWLRHHHQLARSALDRTIPRLVSIRGMLEPWALNHKSWKKRLAWYLYQRADLRAASCHHATSEVEAANLKPFDMPVPICTIPNGVNIPETPSRSKVKPANSSKVALFVGRIHPVKGLPMLVDAWARVRPAGWRVKIVGPDEANHRVEIERLITEAHLSSDFEFTGELVGDDKALAFRNADLCIAPSHTESFGMVVAEALAAGVPVITTKGTPWKDLEKYHCGWWTEVNAEALAEALAEAVALSREQRCEMGARGRALIRERYTWEQAGLAMLRAYEGVLSGTIHHAHRIVSS